MRVSWTIPYIATLDQLEIDSPLMSCGRERWEIAPVDTSHVLEYGVLQALEEYGCRRAMFPFPHIVETLGFRQGLTASQLPVVDPKSATDASWNAFFEGERSEVVGHTRKQSEGASESSDHREQLLSRCSDGWLQWQDIVEDCSFPGYDQEFNGEIYNDGDCGAVTEDDDSDG